MKRVERIMQLTLLLITVYFFQFHKFSEPVFLVFDETRLVTSAYEMSKTGELLTPTIDYSPDMLNLKPPLMIWIQTLCIKVFGLNEFAARLPAALAALFATLLVFFFVKKLTGNGWAALLGGIVLCTSSGYLGEHGTRWGEYNSLLAFFVTLYIISFFMYVETDGERKNKFLMLFFVTITLAVLSKGVAALIFCPALIAYLVLRRQFFSTLMNKKFYVWVMFFLVLIFGYLFFRETYNSGFIKKLNEYELAGRMFNTIKGHSGPLDYYVFGLRYERFGSWFPLLLLSIFISPFIRSKKVFRAFHYCLACFLFYLFIISVSRTKIPAYDIPLYPLLAVLISIGMIQLANWIYLLFPFIKRNCASLVLITVLSIIPMKKSFVQIETINAKMQQSSIYDASYYLREFQSMDKNLKNATYFSDGYDWQWTLYVKSKNDAGMNITHKRLYSSYIFEEGEKVMAHQKTTKYFIETNYNFRVIEDYKTVRAYEILSGKKPPDYTIGKRNVNRELVI